MVEGFVELGGRELRVLPFSLLGARAYLAVS